MGQMAYVMAKAILLIISLLAFSGLYAQQRPMLRERNRPLLKELQLTPRQRMQIQELIRQERVQEVLNNIRLQQILTPAQKQKLLQYNKRKELLDSLDHQKKQP